MRLYQSTRRFLHVSAPISLVYSYFNEFRTRFVPLVFFILRISHRFFVPRSDGFCRFSHCRCYHYYFYYSDIFYYCAISTNIGLPFISLTVLNFVFVICYTIVFSIGFLLCGLGGPFSLKMLPELYKSTYAEARSNQVNFFLKQCRYNSRFIFVRANVISCYHAVYTKRWLHRFVIYEMSSEVMINSNGIQNERLVDPENSSFSIIRIIF